MKRAGLMITTIAAALLLAIPAQAEETYCQYTGIAEILFEYVPQAMQIANMIGIDTGDVGEFMEGNVGNFVTGLREAAMTKDSGEIREYLKTNGVSLAASALDADDWQWVWTKADEISPTITAVFIRRADDGSKEGWLVRVAVYLYERGDIREMSAAAVVGSWPSLEFTPEEEDAAIIWLAEEIAAVRNMRAGQ